MPSISTPKQIAFDAAVKARRNALYEGIADLDELRQRGAAFETLTDQLITIRDMFNAALALEGQNITGDAPHAPFYFDYIESRASNAHAFKDADHSFIGITIPYVLELSAIAFQIARADAVLLCVGLPLTTRREDVQGVHVAKLRGRAPPIHMPVHLDDSSSTPGQMLIDRSDLLDDSSGDRVSVHEKGRGWGPGRRLRTGLLLTSRPPNASYRRS